jgi:hypothetical protein
MNRHQTNARTSIDILRILQQATYQLKSTGLWIMRWCMELERWRIQYVPRGRVLLLLLLVVPAIGVGRSLIAVVS